MRLTQAAKLTALPALVAVIVAMAAVTLPSAASADEPPAPDSPCWSGPVDGRPAQIELAGPEGWYFWHDEAGFHLATTKPLPPGRIFRAILHTDGQFYDLSRIRLEGVDDMDVHLARHEIVLTFRTHNGIDGVNFRIDGGSRLRLALRESGELIPADQIYIGADGVHPDTNPFVLCR